jgi:hypothetical protein
MKTRPTSVVAGFLILLVGCTPVAQPRSEKMDYLDLEPLSDVAQQKRWQFLVTIAAMPIRGGTGSSVNPIAVF